MSKQVKGFKPGDEIPSSATYLSSGIGRTGLMTFYYEIKESPNTGSKRSSVDYNAIAAEVIQHLNIQAGKSFSLKTATTIKLIKARVLDGMTAEQLKIVIDNKVKTWRDDPQMEVYLRPQTLFGNKCEGYYNERDAGADAFAELDSFMGNK